MVELLPAWYDEMARRYEALFPKVSFLDGFLKAYIALEYKIVDCGKLSDAETIEELEFNYGWYIPTIDWTFYCKGLEDGSFTIKDVQAFCEKDPERLPFFLPLLIERGDRGVWESLGKAVREAALAEERSAV